MGRMMSPAPRRMTNRSSRLISHRWCKRYAMQPAIAGRTARYRGPDRILLNCQYAAIRRALANLIDNAVDYGDEADVELSEDDETVRIVIGDRGPGIPAAEREAVFSAYKDPRTLRNRKPGHMGFGLPIARNAIRRCRGDIFLRDREGGGPRSPGDPAETLT